ncbi:MAG TPA: hypothetical protein VLF64_01600 [Candidatus Saccharimonadales bacterium]|nr:hypothetical protein [Candidatus Saccharimonadales bacterium]
MKSAVPTTEVKVQEKKPYSPKMAVVNIVMFSSLFLVWLVLQLQK